VITSFLSLFSRGGAKALPVVRPLLEIELVPQSTWENNLRSRLTPGEWRQVKNKTFELANWKCEKCGGQGDQHPVECHEEWHYDDVRLIQRLVRTIALCPDCHQAVHFGLARVKGIESKARGQLMKVNNWNANQVDMHIADATRIGFQRSKRHWQIDVSWLDEFVEKIPSAQASLF